VDDFYNGLPGARSDALRADRSTNYSVVRLELLEQIYQDLYQQKIKQPDESQWQHRILPSREVITISCGNAKTGGKLMLTIKNISPLRSPANTEQEILEVDAVLLATGYVRNAHEKLLESLAHLRPPASSCWRIRRDYKVEMDEGKVVADAGIWLQGCNESTHGLSDTLLSILATRGGEMVESIFGRAAAEGK
jgi:L-ornithine N5-monooxygenase